MASRRSPALAAAVAVALLALPLIVDAEVYFEEKFGDGWENRWVISDWKKDENMSGNWNFTSGRWSGDPEDKGIQTADDFKFYAISAEFPEFSNKDKTLVLQFSVKHEQRLDCGGGYVKLLSGEVDQKNFSGETPYRYLWVCNQKGSCYFFTQSGNLYKDWDILPPQKIRDPNATKPEGWDDEQFISDPEDKKPEGYDDIPKEILDPNAKKPEDWDDEEDGEWTPPTIPNPAYKGPWKPKKIKNPNYKGKWKAPMIANPDFNDDPDLYVYPNLRYIGIELWQVKSGTLFDNILICDDPEYAQKFAEETWGKLKDAEKAAFDKFEEEDGFTVDSSDDEEDDDEDENNDSEKESNANVGGSDDEKSSKSDSDADSSNEKKSESDAVSEQDVKEEDKEKPHDEL